MMLVLSRHNASSLSVPPWTYANAMDVIPTQPNKIETNASLPQSQCKHRPGVTGNGQAWSQVASRQDARHILMRPL